MSGYPKINSSKYKTLINASYLNNNNDAERLGRSIKYKLDRELSNVKQKVYTHKNKVVVAFQGTDPTRVRDLVSDGMIIFGLEGFNTRFKDANKTMDRVNQKYGNKKIITMGHSLGGTLAEHVGNKADRVITFDKGVGAGTIGKRINRNQTDIRSSNDIISALSLTQSGKRISIPNTAHILSPFRSHDASNINRLEQNIKI
jgi:hypothetical protein